MKTAVIGAGNGGQAIAAHMALCGHEVWIYDIDEAKIKALQKRGAITLEGEEKGTADRLVSTMELAEAVKQAEVIMVVTASSSHDEVARSLSPLLEDGQVVILNPGYSWGALAFSRALKKAGCGKEVIIGDTECMIYSCRSKRPGEVYVSGIKNKLFMATFPGNQIHRALEKVRKAYPQFQPAPNVLETTFGNVNPVLHTPIALLNAGSIESKREFRFYYDGGTPSILHLEEKMDAERLAVARAFGIRARSLRELLADFYGVTGGSLYEAVTRNPAYAPIEAPQSLQTRLITEDVPMGLVPVASAARKFGVPAPLHHMFIGLASALLDVDYWQQGRTMESLGLAERNAAEILTFLNQGEE